MAGKGDVRMKNYKNPDKRVPGLDVMAATIILGSGRGYNPPGKSKNEHAHCPGCQAEIPIGRAGRKCYECWKSEKKGDG